MYIFSVIYRTVLDALFPLTCAEEEVLSLSPEEALKTLPQAPDFSGLAVELPNATSVFAYKDEQVSQLIWHIKYKRTEKAVQIGGFALFEMLTKKFPSAILVPIPITSRRRKERGYNQCELLLDEIARLDVGKQFIIKKDLLIRVQHSERHTLKNREQRVEDVTGIFALSTPQINELANFPIVIIDDVITTGSTMNEAVQTLQKSVTAGVWCLSLAH